MNSSQYNLYSLLITTRCCHSKQFVIDMKKMIEKNLSGFISVDQK